MIYNATEIISTLIKAGLEAHFIGGYVRNNLHNNYHKDEMPVKDIDIVTNASFEEVSKLFDKVEARGEQFKVAVVVINNQEFEVAQYRGETYPEEGSLRPDTVYAVDTLEKDVKRRDFTINGIALNHLGMVIDYVNGEQDIKDEVIRAIGDSNQRFAEDPLRMLRAFRFQSQLGYEIESKTLKGIYNNGNKLALIPHERVAGEMEKLLKGKYAYLALKEMWDLAFDCNTFYNSIIKIQVNFLEQVFDVEHFNFNKTLNRIKNLSNSKTPITHLYAALYSETDWEKAEQEMKDSMFMNLDDIQFVTLVLKHKDLVKDKTSKKLLELLKDMKGKFNNRIVLSEILDCMERVFQSGFHNEDILSRKLFKSELPFNGDDVLREGIKYGFDKPGKWVNEVFELAREKATLGKEYDLETVLKTLRR